MKPQSILAGALALALSASVALGQANPGASPLTIAKGGTNATTASAARTNLGLAIGSATQAWDADLDCMAAISTAGILARTGAGTCGTRTLTAPAAGFTITNPAGTAGDPTFVLANDLAALEGLASTGFAARTGTDAWAQRTLTAPSAGFTITNPAGVAGDPTFVLANDLAALEGLSSTGFAARTTTDTWAQRTITGTANEVCVTNGDGVSGNPTLGICSGWLSTAHTWAGVQTFASPITTGTADVQQAVSLSGDISPTQLVANTNDWAPTGFSTASTVRLSTDASRNITGIAAGADGRVIILHNVGSFSAVLTNQDVASSAGNRFLFGGDITLGADTSITLRYDATSSRWRAITTPGGGGGGGGTVTSAAIAAGLGITVSGTCTITTSGTCTVTQRTATTTTYVTGSGTHTSAAASAFIEVTMCGGSGGGGDSGVAGGAGGSSTFNAAAQTAGGGSGATSGGAGGAGGTASGGETNMNFSGGVGQTAFTGLAGNFMAGGQGGHGTYFSGSTQGGKGADRNGAGNSGAGGGGAGCLFKILPGGGAGYSYAVGAAGTAGGSGTAGKAGIISIVER